MKKEHEEQLQQLKLEKSLHEQEASKLRAEAEEYKQREEERLRLEQERQAEMERQREVELEQQRLKEEENQRQIAAELERQRLEEEEERQRQEELERQRLEEEERQRQAELERQRLEEEEKQRKAEEERLNLEKERAVKEQRLAELDRQSSELKEMAKRVLEEDNDTASLISSVSEDVLPPKAKSCTLGTPSVQERGLSPSLPPTKEEPTEYVEESIIMSKERFISFNSQAVNSNRLLFFEFFNLTEHDLIRPRLSLVFSNERFIKPIHDFELTPNVFEHGSKKSVLIDMLDYVKDIAASVEVRHLKEVHVTDELGSHFVCKGDESLSLGRLYKVEVVKRVIQPQIMFAQAPIVSNSPLPPVDATPVLPGSPTTISTVENSPYADQGVDKSQPYRAVSPTIRGASPAASSVGSPFENAQNPIVKNVSPVVVKAYTPFAVKSIVPTVVKSPTPSEKPIYTLDPAAAVKSTSPALKSVSGSPVVKSVTGSPIKSVSNVTSPAVKAASKAPSPVVNASRSRVVSPAINGMSATSLAGDMKSQSPVPISRLHTPSNVSLARSVSSSHHSENLSSVVQSPVPLSAPFQRALDVGSDELLVSQMIDTPKTPTPTLKEVAAVISASPLPAVPVPKYCSS
ncbi:unnamed protein product [Ambrosiozyma monospora]|uniref:Unnamed protein product n=1 Tax=Ambrosiozyma monospora TaxID=43982 RepID=A0ACB5T734_AMBMO|nr:unnamed protein product [Ambrosiozyma monospora]